MTQDPHRKFRNHMTPNNSRTQRSECMEHCQVTAWIMEFWEQIIRGRATLVTQKEQDKFCSLAPYAAMNMKRDEVIK